ncbi:MAG: GNAT family N-acetyltransferase [Nocardioidaceae bacterium]
MDIRELDQADEALVHRHWEIGKDAEAASRPYDFYPPWETAWLSYQAGREDMRFVLLGAFDGDSMVGAARADLNLLDNLHSAYSSIHVDPVHQRRGVGRALDAACVYAARSGGRRLLMTEAYAPPEADSAGLLFAQAMGYVAGIEDGMKIVDLVETEPTWSALEERAAARRGDYRLVTWIDHVPDELVEDYCGLNEAFFDEAPIGDMEIEPEKWDRKRVEQQEARNVRTGRHVLAAAGLSPDGKMVAMTEVMINERVTIRGFQSGTLVDRHHRGHHLGLAVKLANHRQVRSAYPECRLLLTGNAGVNAPMNVVNDALGYREVERCVEMQKDV